MVLLKVFFGLPLFLFTIGCPWDGYSACLVLSILNTCTNHFHLLCLIAMPFFHFGPSSYLLICFPLWQVSSGFYAWMWPPCSRSFLFIFQVSLPYRRADRMLELNKRIEFFFNWYLIAVPYGSKLLLGRFFFLCIHKCVLCWLKLLPDMWMILFLFPLC